MPEILKVWGLGFRVVFGVRVDIVLGPFFLASFLGGRGGGGFCGEGRGGGGGADKRGGVALKANGGGGVGGGAPPPPPICKHNALKETQRFSCFNMQKIEASCCRKYRFAYLFTENKGFPMKTSRK